MPETAQLLLTEEQLEIVLTWARVTSQAWRWEDADEELRAHIQLHLDNLKTENSHEH